MATKETTQDLPLPTEGGSYIRDDKTGALKRNESQESTQPAVDTAASEKE